MTRITKTLTTIVVAATLGLGVLAAPQAAQAHSRFHGFVTGLFVGGIAAGALVASAIASPFNYYDGDPVYYAPDCFWVRKRVWDGLAWHWRRVRVCE